MKVLIISNSFPRPYDENLGSYNYAQAKAFVNIGNEVVVVSPDPYIPALLGILSHKLKKHSSLHHVYEYGGIQVLCPKMLQYGRLLRKVDGLEYKLYESSVYSYIRDVARKEKVDHILGIGFLLEGRLARKLSRETCIPFSIVEHSNADVIWGASTESRKQRYYSIAQDAENVFFVSSSSKRLFESKIGKLDNFAVNLNGFDFPNFERKIQKRDKRRPLSICSVGFLEERKGHLNTLAVLNRLKGKMNFSYYLIGEGPQKSEILKTIEKYGLQTKCHLLGKISHQEVYKILASTDIFLLLSHNEPLGIVYLEAMSLGNVTIGSTGEGIADVIIDRQNGFLVNPQDTEKIADIIYQCYCDEEYRCSIAKAGQNAVKNLTWENNAKRLESKMREVRA